MEDRRERLLASAGTGPGRFLEFGPLDRPVVAADDTRSVVHVDHLSTEGIREKYADHPHVDVEQIVAVDHVLDGRPLVELVGDGFDHVVASHVLEHVPDPLAWFAEMAEVLRPGGVIALALPDMRTTFDVARPPTSPADLLAAHMERRSAPSVGQVVEHHMYALRHGPAISWAEPVPRSQLQPVHERAYVLEQAERAAAGEYVDVHCWVFTPDSFVANVTVLRSMGLLDFEPVGRPDPGTSEFFVDLRLSPADPAELPAQWDRAFRPPTGPGEGAEGAGPDRAEDRLAAMEASTSWRITAPLRRGTDLARSLARRSRSDRPDR